MTDPGSQKKTKTAWLITKFNFGWFRGAVSLTAVLIVMAVVGAAGVIFISVGGIGVSADTPDSWLATNGLHFVFKRSVASAANRVTPPDDLASPDRVRLGAQHFDMVCANCHGRPGYGQSVVALSMSPRPQYLPKVLGQFTPAELYVIVEHGVKYSAMPSWATDARGDEVWSMVAFLQQLRKMDAKTYRALTALPASNAPTLADADDATLQPANARRNAPPMNEFLYAAPASGFSDRTIHDNPVATCARCHGVDGSGGATGGEAPNLTIQSAGYLNAALEAYVSGARKSGFMQTIASQLSAAQMTALSNYYANLPVQTLPSSAANPALINRGEIIATEGIRASAIPACANCHESAGATLIGAPHIAGQSATYLRRQLTAMGQVGRGSSVSWNPMDAVAHDLSDHDIAALAAYYSHLTPAKKGGVGPAAQPQAPLSAVDMRATRSTFETTCLKCHVNGGRGDLQGDYPNLTIQNTPYAAQSLYAFHVGARLADEMQQVTNGLTLDQMKSLAGYINGLTPLPAVAVPDRNAAARGAVIATKGAPQRGVPACMSCHSANGIAALPLIPPLQGQNVAYLRRKLDAFTEHTPANDYALNPMPAISRKLTERERADLAAYFASASPLRKTAVGP